MTLDGGRERIAVAWCGVRHGHHDVLAFVDGRTVLRCTNCRRETPGFARGEGAQLAGMGGSDRKAPENQRRHKGVQRGGT